MTEMFPHAELYNTPDQKACISLLNETSGISTVEVTSLESPVSKGNKLRLRWTSGLIEARYSVSGRDVSGPNYLKRDSKNNNNISDFVVNVDIALDDKIRRTC